MNAFDLVLQVHRMPPCSEVSFMPSASAAVPPLICALDADLGAMGAGGRAVVYGATGHAAGARLR